MNRTLLFLKKVFIAVMPGWFRLQTRYRCGIVVKGENRPGYGGRGLYLYGEALEPELDILEQLLNDGDVFVDVGANVGAYSMKAARLVGNNGVVIAIEPYPRMADTLLRNIWHNQLWNVRVRVICASDTVGHQKFWMNGNRPNTFSLLPRPGAGCFDSSTTSLDTLIANEGLEKLSFLKIDAEGAENRILKGALSSIAKFKPIVMVEDGHERNPLIPDSYVGWKIPGSPNLLFFPSDSDSNRSFFPEKLGCVRWSNRSLT